MTLQEIKSTVTQDRMTNNEHSNGHVKSVEDSELLGKLVVRYLKAYQAIKPDFYPNLKLNDLRVDQVLALALGGDLPEDYSQRITSSSTARARARSTNNNGGSLNKAASEQEIRTKELSGLSLLLRSMLHELTAPDNSHT